MLVGEHHLGPVHHGRHQKLQGVRTQGQGAALLDREGVGEQAVAVKLSDQLKGLGVAHQGQPRVQTQQGVDLVAVVRLHMVDDQVIKPAAIQHRLDIVQKLPRDGRVHRVNERGLFILD